MPKSSYRAELWRCLIWLGAFALFGLISGYFAIAICLGLSTYLLRLFILIHQLGKWVNNTRFGASPSKDEFSGICADIGYNVQSMIAKHEKEKQRLQAVVDRIQAMTAVLTDGVVLVDKRGNMDWWNKAAEVLFNLRGDDLGHKLTNLIRNPRFVEYFEQHNDTAPLELSIWQEDRQLEFQVHAFANGERLVIARDITRLYRLEEMRKDFVANVSHELRTPLTVIRGYLETFADNPQLPPTWHKPLAQMEQQSLRMSTLIDDLIALAKLETDEKRPTELVALAPMIEDIINDAKALTETHNFSVQGDATLTIEGNESELRSAFSNLVINAINHSGNATRIHIEYKRLSNEAVLSVSDNGIGIDPKHLPRLTERFYRVDPSRTVASGGTGLGLAIVKHIMLRHHAELKIHSVLGKGSTFSCYFPSSVVSPTKPTETTPTRRG